jgi:hypothetical protein
MKPLRILFCAAVASLMAIVGGNAQIIPHNWYPPMILDIHGVFAWENNIGGDYGAYTEWDLDKVRFNSKDLIEMLNASATFTNVLNNVNGVTEIPAGSYLIIDIDRLVMLQWWNDWAIVVTNRNGFSFPLNSVYDPVQGQYYTFMDVYHETAVGSCKFINSTAAGHEIDMAALHFTFDDGDGTVFEFFGVGDFKWTMSPKDDIFAGIYSQKVSIAGKVVGGGNAIIDGYKPSVMQATLTLKGREKVESFQPFQMWWNRNMWYPTLGIPPLVR